MHSALIDTKELRRIFIKYNTQKSAYMHYCRNPTKSFITSIAWIVDGAWGDN